MLHNEARELLVESYEKTHNAEEIAKIFGVNKYTVYHMAERKRKTGSVALRTSQRGRKQLLNDEDKQHIRQCIDEMPDINPGRTAHEAGTESKHPDAQPGGSGDGIPCQKEEHVGIRTGAAPMCGKNVQTGADPAWKNRRITWYFWTKAASTLI